ncbi:hypothetical protein [Dyella choica]|uniref:Uncharacterized protein n=1 Tax=Dyella choica TaxID=1927959 RepID=A0A432MAR4_9GAMM|nr:hypothetical protein [Dyella choica]RUL78821.1 hypothetical protein EKH80_03165 [Dyella choica]
MKNESWSEDFDGTGFSITDAEYDSTDEHAVYIDPKDGGDQSCVVYELVSAYDDSQRRAAQKAEWDRCFVAPLWKARRKQTQPRTARVIKRMSTLRPASNARRPTIM